MTGRKRNIAADKRAAALSLNPARPGRWCNGFVIPERAHIADVCAAHRRVEVINSLNRRK